MKQYKFSNLELTIQLHKQDVKCVKIKSCEDAANFFLEIWEGLEIYESFFVLYLNAAGKTIGWYKASQGGVNSTIVDVKLKINFHH